MNLPLLLLLLMCQSILGKSRQHMDVNITNIEFAPNNPFMLTNTAPRFLISLVDPLVDTMVSRYIYDYGIWDNHVLMVLHSLLGGADPTASHDRSHWRDRSTSSVVFDVGANLGFFGLYASACGYKTYGFEPQQKMQEMVTRSVAVNGFKSYTLVKSLVTKVEETRYIMNVEGGNFGGAGMLTKEQCKTHQGGCTPVKSVTIDAMVASTGRDVLVMKVDVEGYETEVFHGAQKAMKAHKIKNILMEFTPTVLGIDSAKKMLELIASYGYKVKPLEYRGVVPSEEAYMAALKSLKPIDDLNAFADKIAKKGDERQLGFIDLWWYLSE